MSCKTMDLTIQIDISSSPNNLTEIHEGKVCLNDTTLVELHKIVACRSEWGGEVDRLYMDNDCQEIPGNIDLTYLSYSESKFYTVKAQLSRETIEQFCNKYESAATILIGMAPLGEVAVWVRNQSKSVVVNWLRGKETNVPMNVFLPIAPDLSLSEYCEAYNKRFLQQSNSDGHTHCMQLHQFANYMKQFEYRYIPIFENWNESEKKWKKYNENDTKPLFHHIEESLYDGTHDKLHDGGLMKYHMAGKPKKLRVEWHIGKSEYSAYFWFEDERIREVFDRFYGAHPDTKTDFIIRIDAEKRKYELALYRYGLKEPQVIPEDVYQLLVFKNKFEDYRSDNYNQERGAWIW